MSFPALRSRLGFLGLPVLTTQDVTSITSSTATGNGTVVSIGQSALTERGICWSTSVNPTTANSTATSAGQGGAFTASITGLSASTLYFVRAYAINSLGTQYGDNVSFSSSGGILNTKIGTRYIRIPYFLRTMRG